MKTAWLGVLVLAAFLAFLPASLSPPVMAQGGSISKIALGGDILSLPPAPPYRTQQVNTLYDFGPADVNNGGGVVFFSRYLEQSDLQNVCALLASSGGPPGVVAASQDPCPPHLRTALFVLPRAWSHPPNQR